MGTIIKYGTTKEAWDNFLPFVEERIRESRSVSICDIGGGANPHLSLNTINNLNLDYWVLDISETELNKADPGYNKIVANIAEEDLTIAPEKKFDLIFSKMLAEHVKDAESFHRNVFNLLKPGGCAIHFFPTLYAFPFLVNYLLPEYLAGKILNLVAPRDRYRNEKFPAYYCWCRGPTINQIGRFEEIGYVVDQYHGYFGHEGYYSRLGILKRIHLKKTQRLLKNPNPLFTSYAYVVVRRP
jgi:SAM-dependent methyltransferase